LLNGVVVIIKKRIVFTTAIVILGIVLCVWLFNSLYYPELSLEFFEDHQADMMKVVDLIESNCLHELDENDIMRETLPFKNSNPPFIRLSLPLSYRFLSHKGNVFCKNDVDNLKVFFVAGYRFFSGDMAVGYYYSSKEFPEGYIVVDGNDFPNWRIIDLG